MKNLSLSIIIILSLQSFKTSWSMHFGFIRVQVDTKPSEVKIKLLPFGVYSFVSASFKGNFKLKESLLVGTPYFETNELISNQFFAGSFGNGIVVHKDLANKYKTIAHEYIHGFQFREYIAFNSFLADVNEKSMTKTLYKKLSKYIYLDLPYHWLFYLLEGIPDGRSCHFDNFYEIEAEFFATLKPVSSCP